MSTELIELPAANAAAIENCQQKTGLSLDDKSEAPGGVASITLTYPNGETWSMDVHPSMNTFTLALAMHSIMWNYGDTGGGLEWAAKEVANRLAALLAASNEAASEETRLNYACGYPVAGTLKLHDLDGALRRVATETIDRATDNIFDGTEEEKVQ